MLDAKTQALVKSLFAKDEDGNIYLRMVAVGPSEDLKLENAVNTQSTRSISTLLSSAIVLDADNNPALRVAGVEFGQTVLAYQKEENRIAAEYVAKVKKQQADAHKASK